jgi:hypothetical protein
VVRRVVRESSESVRTSAKVGWPPKGQFTYRQCAEQDTKRGKPVRCEQVALVPLLPGVRPIAVDPKAKVRCKRHGGKS